MEASYQYRWQQFAHSLMDDLFEAPRTTLPGVRELARRYGVSHTTVEHALDHLQELDVIAPAKPGKRRRIHVARLQEIGAWKGRETTNRILFISAFPVIDLSYVAYHIHEVLRKLCEPDDLYLSCISSGQVPLSKWKSLLTELNPRGIIFFWDGGTISDLAHSMGIPAIVLGASHPDIPSFYQTNLHCAAFRRAVAAGHSRIVSPIVQMQDDKYDILASILEKLCSECSIPFSSSYNLPSVMSGSVEDYHAVLHNLFRYTPPTCLILEDISHYLATSSFLMERGMRIPDDVSVLLLTQHPLLEDIRPTIAHCEQYSAEMVSAAYAVLKEQISGLRSNEEVALPPAWVPGNSLAPPRPA